MSQYMNMNVVLCVLVEMGCWVEGRSGNKGGGQGRLTLMSYCQEVWNGGRGSSRK